MDIYVQKDGHRQGPFSATTIRQRIASGELAPTDLGWIEGNIDWLPLEQLLGFPVGNDSCVPTDEVSSEYVTGTRVEKVLVYAVASLLLSVAALIWAFHDYKWLWFFGTLSAIVLGHYVCWRTRAQMHQRTIRRLALGGMLTGYAMTAIYVAFLSLVFSVGHTFPASEKPVEQVAQVRVEQLIADQLQKNLEVNKQKIFDNIHPLGTAKSVTLHDVSITAWKHGRDTNRMEDIQQFTIRYTLYWSTAFTTDGFTKISQAYDAESQRYVETKILATNGMTNRDAQGALTSALGTLLEYHAQKAGAEDAAREYYQNQ